MKVFSAAVFSILTCDYSESRKELIITDSLPSLTWTFKKRGGDMEGTSLISDCFHHLQRYDLGSWRLQGKGKLGIWVADILLCEYMVGFCSGFLLEKGNLVVFFNGWYRWGSALDQVCIRTLRKDLLCFNMGWELKLKQLLLLLKKVWWNHVGSLVLKTWINLLYPRDCGKLFLCIVVMRLNSGHLKFLLFTFRHR